FSSRRRHTRSDRDWSSDVCSSDLCVEILFLSYSRGQVGETRIDSPLAVSYYFAETHPFVLRFDGDHAPAVIAFAPVATVGSGERSEERRVGKGGRSRGWGAELNMK